MIPITGKRLAHDPLSEPLETGSYTAKFTKYNPYGKNLGEDPVTLLPTGIERVYFEFEIQKGPPQGEHKLDPIGRKFVYCVWMLKLDADGNDLIETLEDGTEKNWKDSNDRTRGQFSMLANGLGAAVVTDANENDTLDFSPCVGRTYVLALSKAKNPNARGEYAVYLNKVDPVSGSTSAPKKNDDGIF